MKAKITNTSANKHPSKAKPYEICDSDMKGFILRIQPSGVKSFYVSYRNSEGIKKRYLIGKLGTITPSQARKIAGEKLAEVKQGKDIQNAKKESIASAKKAESEQLGAFIDNIYEPWRLAQRKDGKAEVKRIRRNFSHLFQLPMYEISPFLIESWRIKRKNAGISSKTINRDVNGLRSVFSHAINCKILAEHPLRNTKPLKVADKGKVRFFEVGEEEALRNALNEREATLRQDRINYLKWQEARNIIPLQAYRESEFVDHVKPIVLLLINTGMRPSELLQLQWKDICWETNTIHVLGENTKNSKTRSIPLSDEARKSLSLWNKQNCFTNDSLCFPSPETGKVMKRLPRAITRVIRKAELNDFRPYDLRHAFASKLAMNKVDLNTIRELLGHADISTTLIYAHLSEEHKSDAIKQTFG